MKKVMAERDRQSKIHYENESARCKNKRKSYDKALNNFEKKMQKRLANYAKKEEMINTQIAEIQEAKADHKKQKAEREADIQMYKNELLELRSRLLVEKANQVKGEQLGQIYQSDLEDSLFEFQTMTDVLKMTKLSLREVQKALERVSSNLKSFKVGLEIFKSEIEGQINNFAVISREVNKCSQEDFANDRCKQITNALLAQDSLDVISRETRNAGLGCIVLAKMYNTLYIFLSNLEDYPVGLYDEELTIEQNMKNFQNFVKKMNKQRDLLNEKDDQLSNIEKQIENINGMCEAKGVTKVTVESNIETTIFNSRK